jgi:hypothetical protein
MLHQPRVHTNTGEEMQKDVPVSAGSEHNLLEVSGEGTSNPEINRTVSCSVMSSISQIDTVGRILVYRYIILYNYIFI